MGVKWTAENVIGQKQCEGTERRRKKEELRRIRRGN